MRLLRENACAPQWARGPPTHLFTRSFVHSSTGMSSGAPVTCPALSGHQAAARSVAGSHRLGVDLLCRSQARRQWGRVGAGPLSCEDAMRARRRSGRGAREFTAPPSCPASPRPCWNLHLLSHQASAHSKGQVFPGGQAASVKDILSFLFKALFEFGTSHCSHPR